MNLAQTQALLWRAITWPTGVEDFLAHADVPTRRAFAETFAQTEAFSAVARVRVYAEAYFWRLFEVALDQYPVTAWLAGRPAFHDLVTDFVLTRPSTTPDIRRFAAGLPRLLRTHRLEAQIPGLADVAAVDWAINDAVDLPDEPRLTMRALQQMPPEAWPDARFLLTRTATVLECALPYSVLRKAWAAEANPPPLEPAQTTVLVWRQADHDVYQRPVSPPEASALRALSTGATFAEVCDAAAWPSASETSTTDIAADVSTWLRRWLDDDLLIQS